MSTHALWYTHNSENELQVREDIQWYKLNKQSEIKEIYTVNGIKQATSKLKRCERKIHICKYILLWTTTRPLVGLLEGHGNTSIGKHSHLVNTTLVLIIKNRVYNKMKIMFVYKIKSVSFFMA